MRERGGVGGGANSVTSGSKIDQVRGNYMHGKGGGFGGCSF